jgi:hypothetical protein
MVDGIGVGDAGIALADRPKGGAGDKCNLL